MSFDLKISGGDLVISSSKIEIVEDSDKLIQDILKICLTPIGANKLNAWYGSPVSKTIIGSSLDRNMLLTVGKSQLQNAIENLQSLQKLQVKSYQSVSANEHISSILSISINSSNYDSRLFEVFISILSKGFRAIKTSFRVS